MGKRFDDFDGRKHGVVDIAKEFEYVLVAYWRFTTPSRHA
jgi:hypothetical protein